MCNRPVIAPATNPAIIANKTARIGFIPLTIATAQTAPPVAKLPSTVKSAKSNNLKVM